MNTVGKGRGIGKGLLSASVVSAFVLCGRMVKSGEAYLPDGWRGAWISTAAAFAFVLLILPFFSVITDMTLGPGEKNPLQKIICGLISVILCAAALWVMLSVTREGANFVTAAMGLERNEKLIGIVLIFSAACIAASGREAVKKLSLVTLAIAALCAAALLALAFARGGAASLNELVSQRAIAEGGDVTAIRRVFVGVFAPTAVGAAWLSQSSREKGRLVGTAPNALLGVALGGAVIALCFATVLISQGAAYASVREYPYLSSVGSMTAGKLFMRPEGIAYIAYLSSVLSALAICLSFVCRLVTDKKAKLLPFAAAAVMSVVCYFLL